MYTCSQLLERAERAARRKEYLRRKAAGLPVDDDDEFKDVMEGDDNDDYGYDSEEGDGEGDGRRYGRGRGGRSDDDEHSDIDGSDHGYDYNGRRRNDRTRSSRGIDDSNGGHQGMGLNNALYIGAYQQLIDSNNNDWVNVLGEEKKYKMVQTTAFGMFIVYDYSLCLLFFLSLSFLCIYIYVSVLFCFFVFCKSSILSHCMSFIE
jgi:hypothetical protein